MSEAPVAPSQGATPSPAAPVSSETSQRYEIPVNENPTAIPAGRLAGPREAPRGGRGARPLRRRESIRAAFERAQNPQKAKAEAAAKPKPQAAEAKKGHNNPPEHMADEDKLDLKKRPSDQPRGDRGQFAPKQSSENQDQTPRILRGGLRIKSWPPARRGELILDKTSAPIRSRRMRRTATRCRECRIGPGKNGRRHRRVCAAKSTAWRRSTSAPTSSIAATTRQCSRSAIFTRWRNSTAPRSTRR